MNAFFDFIFTTYWGGLIWSAVGFVFFFSVKQSKDWRKKPTEGENFRKFSGICMMIFGVCIMLNLLYNNFHKP